MKYSYAKPNTPESTSLLKWEREWFRSLNLQWDPVPGATEYKVAIFNGYDYEYISVGNVTSWTTKDKKIFPTPEEIAQGRYWIHDDGKGQKHLPTQDKCIKNALSSRWSVWGL